MILTVKVDELFETVNQMHDDKMEYVDIMLMEADDSIPDDPLPPSISFSAWREDSSFMRTDYEDVEGTVNSDD